MTEILGPVPGPGILDIAIYVPGEAKVEGAVAPARLASNESALGPSSMAVAALRELAGEMHRYPEGDSATLRAALGRVHALDPERIVCGAGSDELIALLLRAYAAGPDTEVLHSRHGFMMYAIGALAVGAKPIPVPERNLTVDVDAIVAHVNDRTRIVFIANPNNPTGTYLSEREMARLAARLPPRVLLVIDAAYAEFVSRNDYEPGTRLVDKHPNVVMLRTFSKIYAMAALRLGWGYFPPAIADVMNRVRGPFNVSAAAQLAGLAALDDTDALRRAQAHNNKWLPWLSGKLAGLGLDPTPSVGNFVLPRFPDDGRHDADSAFEFLLSRHIITRKMGGYGLPDRIRITVGTAEENHKVAMTLAEFMAS
jgi:histidinol-phosphate aminotransferase